MSNTTAEMLRVLISHKYYKTAKVAKKKISVLYMVDELTDEECSELNVLVGSTYTEV